MVIIGLLSSQHHREHHLRHELDQLLFDDRIHRDFAVACQIELKLLHAVPPLLFEEQSHWHLSSLDLLPARPTLPEHWRSISHWERSRFLTPPDEPSHRGIFSEDPRGVRTMIHSQARTELWMTSSSCPAYG